MQQQGGPYSMSDHFDTHYPPESDGDDIYPPYVTPSPYEDEERLTDGYHSVYTVDGSEKGTSRGNAHHRPSFDADVTHPHTKAERSCTTEEDVKASPFTPSRDNPFKSPFMSDLISSCSALLKRVTLVTLVGLVLWLPGLLAVFVYGATADNGFDHPTVLLIGIFWWSVWLSSVWVGYFVCVMVVGLVPIITRRYLGLLSIAFKTLLDFADATQRYVAIFLWTLLAWITYLTIVYMRFPYRDSINSGAIDPLSSNSPTNGTSSLDSSTAAILSLVTTQNATASVITEASSWHVGISRFLFGLVICSAILLAEKVAIQSIALSFHRVSYADRIKLSNSHLRILATLYAHAPSSLRRSSMVLLAETEASPAVQQSATSSISNRARRHKTTAQKQSRGGKILQAVSMDFGSALQPYSPRTVVETSLESVGQTLKLAKRIFRSFACSHDKATGEVVLTARDLATPFHTTEEQQHAFATFDVDGNGSCTWEEFRTSMIAMHKERICLLASLHDIDSAVLKLDNIFMSFYVVVGCVIIAALLSTKFSTLVASLGTIMLGLSWLIGSTAQESLASIVWVFCKHPIDVGDAIEVPGLLSVCDGSQDATFFVEEIQLLSTILQTRTGKYVTVSNYHLAQQPIVNLRRSGPIRERFQISVGYETSFEKIETLRTKMMQWISTQGRDFVPGLDVKVQTLGDQTSLALSLDIRYKSNWQDDQLWSRRRNKWICTLKGLMRQLDIYGPGGKPAGDQDDCRDANTAYTLMDAREDEDDTSSSCLREDSRSVTQEEQERSRLHPVMPHYPRRQNQPTHHATVLNARGRRGSDERVGDLASKEAY